MAASAFRIVPLHALSSRVPRPEERARFMSVQSAVLHLSAATGAFTAASVLEEIPGGRLARMDVVALGASALAASVPVLMWLVESRVRRRDRAAGGSGGTWGVLRGDPTSFPTSGADPE
jgi:hypothetical protein